MDPESERLCNARAVSAAPGALPRLIARCRGKIGGEADPDPTERAAVVTRRHTWLGLPVRLAPGFPWLARVRAVDDDPVHTVAGTKRSATRERFARVAAPLALLVPLAQLAAILWLIWTRTPHLPFWDEWEMANFLELADRGRLDLGAFWAFQNEHRIVLPRLLLYALIAATGWQRQVIMTANLGLAVATAALIAVALRRTLGRAAFAAVAAPLALLLFSLAQYENWLFAFQTNFLLAAWGIACCLLGVTPPRAAARPSRRGFVLAVLGATVASLSTLAGLLAWPAFLPAIWRAGHRRAAVWCLAAAAIAIPYFDGFPLGTTRLAGPGELVRYGLAYLGAPLGAPTVGLAIGCGLLGLILLPLDLALLRRLGAPPGVPLPWLCVGLFALTGMALTAVGRAALGPEQALTSRYQLFASFWWLGLLAVATILATRARAPHPTAHRTACRVGRGVNTALLILLGCGLVRANVVGFIEAGRWQRDLLAHERCALRYESAPDSCLLRYYVSAPVARIHLAFLEQHRLGLFRGQVPGPGLPPAAGAALSHFDRVNGRSDIASTVTLSTTAPTRLTGWALDPAAGSPATAAYIVIDGRDTYRATYGLARPDVGLALGMPTLTQVGFAATLPEGILAPGEHTLTVRLIAADGRAYADGGAPLRITGR